MPYINAYKLMEYANNQKDKTIDANDIARFPYADVVERSAYDQVAWERDTAIAQLASIGKGLGEKMDDVAVRKKGRWINDNGLYRCSSCNQLWAEWWAASKPIERMKKECPYCPMCGSDNREESDNG